MHWGAIESAIFGISSFSWLIALCLALIAQYRRIDYSIRVTIFIWVAFDLVTLVVTPLIYELTAVDKELTRKVWYVAFSFLALSQMFAISFVHLYLNIRKSDVAKLIMFSLLCFIFINVIRYFDRVVIETNVFAEVYRYGTMSLKLLVLLYFTKCVAKNKGVGFAN